MSSGRGLGLCERASEMCIFKGEVEGGARVVAGLAYECVCVFVSVCVCVCVCVRDVFF